MSFYARAKFGDITQAAQFCAELVRQGIAFEMHVCADTFIVVMTGY